MWLRDACGGEKDVEKERDPPRRQVETRASKGRRFSMGGEWQSLDFVPVLRRGDDSKHEVFNDPGIRKLEFHPFHPVLFGTVA